MKHKINLGHSLTKTFYIVIKIIKNVNIFCEANDDKGNIDTFSNHPT